MSRERPSRPDRDEKGERIHIEGPPLTISRDAGVGIALCLHELATNVIKYGALSFPDEGVRVRWSVSSASEPQFMLEWTEQGGPTVTPPSRSGYGTRDVRARATGRLGEPPEIDFRRGSCTCTATGLFPASMRNGRFVRTFTTMKARAARCGFSASKTMSCLSCIWR